MRYIAAVAAFLIISLPVFPRTNEGIIVFTQKGCSRCEYTIDFLKQKNITFTEYKIEDESYNNKMWNLIEGSGNGNVERIKMPVIVNNGVVYFSIENLDEFLKNYR